MKNTDIHEWRVIARSYQITNADERDGYFELTNGNIRISLARDYEGDERKLHIMAAALNKWNLPLRNMDVDLLELENFLLTEEAKNAADLTHEVERSEKKLAGALEDLIDCASSLQGDLIFGGNGIVARGMLAKSLIKARIILEDYRSQIEELNKQS